MDYLSLFSGIGGLDLALDALGHKCVTQVEFDPYCTRVLEARWPEVHRRGDVKSVDGADVPPVDLIAGGFPCQPVSVAGRGLAQADERWLWPEFARLVGELEPQRVFIENVPGLRNRGLQGVLTDLRVMGYGGVWMILSAEQVGAWHERKRLWILAQRGMADFGGPLHHPPGRSAILPTPMGSDSKWRSTPNTSSDRATARRTISLHDAILLGRATAEPQRAWPTPRASEWKGTGPLGSKSHEYRRDRQYLDATVQEAEQASGPLNPDWVEWLMGLPMGWTEPGADPVYWPWDSEPSGVPRLARDVANRKDRLKAIGNAVVPQCAAAAYTILEAALAEQPTLAL